MKKIIVYSDICCTLEVLKLNLMNKIFFTLLFLLPLTSVAQTIRVDEVTLSVIEGNKVEMVANKIPNGYGITREVIVMRIPNSANDKDYDLTEISMGPNYFDISWDGVAGTYELVVKTTKNGKTTTKKNKLILK